MLLPDELGRQVQQQMQQQAQLNSQVFTMRVGVSKEVFMLFLAMACRGFEPEIEGEEWKDKSEENGDGQEESGGINMKAMAVDAVAAADALLSALGFTVTQGKPKD